MIDDALSSFREMFTPPFRLVLFKVLGLTLAALAALWIGLEHGVAIITEGGAPWLQALVKISAGIGLFIGLAFLIAPVSMLVAGFFLDELADHVEADIYPKGMRGKAAPVTTSLWLAATSSFGWYVRHMGSYNVMYGSIGAGIALLVWMYLLAIIALIACEFNAAYERIHRR